MTTEETRAAVIKALGELAPEAEVAGLVETRPLREQVDLDSFDFLQLMVRLEELTGVGIPERDYADISTIKELVEYLSRRSGPASTSGR